MVSCKISLKPIQSVYHHFLTKNAIGGDGFCITKCWFTARLLVSDSWDSSLSVSTCAYCVPLIRINTLRIGCNHQ